MVNFHTLYKLALSVRCPFILSTFLGDLCAHCTEGYNLALDLLRCSNNCSNIGAAFLFVGVCKYSLINVKSLIITIMIKILQLLHYYIYNTLKAQHTLGNMLLATFVVTVISLKIQQSNFENK